MLHVQYWLRERIEEVGKSGECVSQIAPLNNIWTFHVHFPSSTFSSISSIVANLQPRSSVKENSCPAPSHSDTTSSHNAQGGLPSSGILLQIHSSALWRVKQVAYFILFSQPNSSTCFNAYLTVVTWMETTSKWFLCYIAQFIPNKCLSIYFGHRSI